jgi:hypothetical protein
MELRFILALIKIITHFRHRDLTLCSHPRRWLSLQHNAQRTSVTAAAMHSPHCTAPSLSDTLLLIISYGGERPSGVRHVPHLTTERSQSCSPWHQHAARSRKDPSPRVNWPMVWGTRASQRYRPLLLVVDQLMLRMYRTGRET